MNKSARRLLVTTAIAVGTLHAGTWRADADFIQTNLVSDIQGLAALTDSELHNPWGISHTATSPIWVSNQGTNTSTLYQVTPTLMKVSPMGTDGNIGIPTSGSGPAQGPTGQVANTDTSSFLVNGTSARFIFANLNGTISAFAGLQNAVIAVPVPSSGAAPLYTGLAISTTLAQPRLYAANGAGSGSIDVFDKSFAKLNLGSGAFTLPQPNGLVPFNVQNIGGNIYVTYAPSGVVAQRNATPGMGAVAIFNENGQFQRMAAGGVPLAAPWGLALAPAGFGPFSGDLRSFSSSAVAVATSREGRRSPRSGRANLHRRWEREQPQCPK